MLNNHAMEDDEEMNLLSKTYARLNYSKKH